MDDSRYGCGLVIFTIHMDYCRYSASDRFAIGSMATSFSSDLHLLEINCHCDTEGLVNTRSSSKRNECNLLK